MIYSLYTESQRPPKAFNIIYSVYTEIKRPPKAKKPSQTLFGPHVHYGQVTESRKDSILQIKGSLIVLNNSEKKVKGILYFGLFSSKV